MPDDENKENAPPTGDTGRPPATPDSCHVTSDDESSNDSDDQADSSHTDTDVWSDDEEGGVFLGYRWRDYGLYLRDVNGRNDEEHDSQDGGDNEDREESQHGRDTEMTEAPSQAQAREPVQQRLERAVVERQRAVAEVRGIPTHRGAVEEGSSSGDRRGDSQQCGHKRDADTMDDDGQDEPDSKRSRR